MEQLANATPQRVREMIRRNEIIRPTAGLCQGHVQANLAVVPKALAYDFLLFCQRNPKPCPVLDVTDVGSPEPRLLGPGADLRYDMEITLEDAFHGKDAEIAVEVSQACDPCGGTGATPGTSARRCNLCKGHGKVRAQQGFFMVERPCPTCHGRGEIIESPCKHCRGEGRVDAEQKLAVNIPAGVDNGTRIRLAGKGEAGPFGAPAGDLYIFLHVQRHSMFEREGTTLLTRCPISFTTAALGGEVEIPGMDGRVHTIEIPAGIQSGKQLRKRGAGMPVLQGRGVGDLVVEIQVETPSKLTARQKEILKEFEEISKGDVAKHSPKAKGWFDKVTEFFGG